MVFEKIKEILVEQLNADADSITMSTKLVEDLSADSIDKAEIVTQLEDTFNIIVDYDEALKVKTVGDIVAAITKVMG